MEKERAEVNVKFTVVEGEGLTSVLVDEVEVIDVVDKEEMMSFSGSLVLQAMLKLIESL